MIRIGGSQHLFFLHMGFKSFDWGFESVNHNNLTGIWIRIASWGIRIAFVSLNFLECGFESPFEGFESPSSNLLEKLQNWRVACGIRIALLGIRIWSLENSSKCLFVKIFLGIFIYILKHLLSLISKHNMSILVLSKSTRVHQSPLFDDDKTPY